jgi:hypothetical protein
MRHLIVLSGNSLKNKAWGELMLAEYGPQFDTSYMLEYDHWASGEGNINFEVEEAKLRDYVASLGDTTEVTVFAKSAGSLLAFLAIHHGAVTPARVAFFGIPFDLAATELFKDNWGAVDAFKLPAIAFHNVEDPTTSYEFTKATLAAHAPHIKLITTHEADHWYGDTQTYKKSLDSFLTKITS